MDFFSYLKLQYPVWHPDSIHIHSSRCSHKGNGRKISERSLDPTNPCCFNLEQICRRKRNREHKKLNSCRFQLFLLHFLLLLPLSCLFFACTVPPTHANKRTCMRIHARTDTHTLVASLFPCFLFSPSRLGEQMSAEGINGKETGVHTSSDSRCDLLNLPLFQKQQSSLALWESFDSAASGSVTGT